MSKRKDTPDLLGDILGGSNPSAPPTPPQQSAKRQKLTSKKVRNTVHITQETHDNFEQMHLEIRRLIGHKVSRSELVEACVYYALEDWRKNGANSWVVQLLPDLFDF